MVRPMDEDSSAIAAQFRDPVSLKALLPQLEQAIESAMAASSGRAGPPAMSPQNQSGGTGSAAPAASAGIGGGRSWGHKLRVLSQLEVVRGIPFYGYHGEEKLFVKVCGDTLWCVLHSNILFVDDPLFERRRFVVG